MKKKWRSRLFTATLIAGSLAVLGATVLLSGVVPIKASSGHWSITEFVLKIAKRRSVSAHTLFTEVPRLDDPALVLKGAGAFDGGCRPCHGAPDLPRQPRVAEAMLPPPPALSNAASTWPPEELYYIVKHGIKFTGMPAWPSQGRDDEVWAIVAFLLELPRIDAHRYRALVHGDAIVERDAIPLEDLVGAEVPPRAVKTTCARCHGTDGRGRGNAAFPVLAGQRLPYLRDALMAYVTRRRHSGIMETALSGLTEDDLDVVARYYARLPTEALPSGGDALPRPTPPPATDLAALARGRSIAVQGVPERRVPACVDCHGPAPLPENEHAPILAGQHAEYLVLQLELFAQDKRGGGSHAHVMQPVARRLTKQQMHDVALFFATLSTNSVFKARRR